MISHGTLFSYPRLEYRLAWEFQRVRARDRADDRCPNSLILLEHPPTYTMGRSGFRRPQLLAASIPTGDPTPLHVVERGGLMTYHGPGQLVGYPILTLRAFCSGPRAYIQMLEEVVLEVLKEWDISGFRRKGFPGVWVGERSPQKIASVGVHITRGVTMHGFALNANCHLTPFDAITPCGIADCRMTSMEAVLGQSVDFPLLQKRMATVFAAVFGIIWTQTHSEFHEGSPIQSLQQAVFLNHHPPQPLQLSPPFHISNAPAD